MSPTLTGCRQARAQSLSFVAGAGAHSMLLVRWQVAAGDLATWRPAASSAAARSAVLSWLPAGTRTLRWRAAKSAVCHRRVSTGSKSTVVCMRALLVHTTVRAVLLCCAAVAKGKVTSLPAWRIYSCLFQRGVADGQVTQRRRSYKLMCTARGSVANESPFHSRLYSALLVLYNDIAHASCHRS